MPSAAYTKYNMPNPSCVRNHNVALWDGYQDPTMYTVQLFVPACQLLRSLTRTGLCDRPENEWRGLEMKHSISQGRAGQ